MISNQAKAAAFGGRVDAALGLALESVRIGREHLRLTAAGLSEREALEYAGEQADRLDLALSLAVEPTLDDPTFIAAAWDALIRSRGQVLDEMAGRRIIAAAAPEIAPLAAAVRRAASHLSRHMVEGHGPATDEEIRLARQELELAERALGEASPPFARTRGEAEIGLDEVTAGLPAGAALVAYARFNRRFTQDPVRRTNTAKPGTSPLSALRRAGSRCCPWPRLPPSTRWSSTGAPPPADPAGGEDASRRAGERLRSTIWDPVAAVFGDPEKVLLIPDGELGLLNFAALPTGDDTFLVEQGPLLAILGQERDLVPDPSDGRSGPCLLAFGDPDFNAAPDGSADGAPSAVGSERPAFRRRRPAACPAFVSPSCREPPPRPPRWPPCGRKPRAASRCSGSPAARPPRVRSRPSLRVFGCSTWRRTVSSSVAGASSPAGSGRGVGALVPAAGAAARDPDG